MGKRNKGRAPTGKDRGAKRPTGAPPTSALRDSGVEVMGWTILAHPLFLSQIERLVAAAEAERAGTRRKSGPNTRLLAHVLDLAFETIPRNPGHSAFRHAGTLGKDRKHWFRAKTGNGRYRLFYRYQSAARIIVYAWVNDEDSLRAYETRTDAYTVFARMLDMGNPPDEWYALVAAASEPAAAKRLSAVTKRMNRRK